MAPPVETGPAVILPASPGYPLLGCASAEPNSVSPGLQIVTKPSCLRFLRQNETRHHFGKKEEFQAVTRSYPRIAIARSLDDLRRGD